MRIRAYNLVFATVLLMAAIAPKARAESPSSQEYQVKAAFLCNFLQFVDWPEEKLADGNEPITIGIIGNDPFGDALDPVKDKKIQGKSITVKRFKSFEDMKNSSGKDKPEALTKCHLLFICTSEQKSLKEIIDTVKDHGVLTVGEMEGFLEGSGIINLLVEDKKIRFEINNAAAGQAKLKIRSNLLRLAKRVIEEDSAKKNEKSQSSSWAELIQYAEFAKYNNKV